MGGFETKDILSQDGEHPSHGSGNKSLAKPFVDVGDCSGGYGEKRLENPVVGSTVCRWRISIGLMAVYFRGITRTRAEIQHRAGNYC
jgi:hypothetical protein